MIKKISLIVLSLCLLINSSACAAIEGGGSGGDGYVPYTGASEDVDVGSYSLNAGIYKIGGTPVIKLADLQNTYVGVNAGGGTSGNNCDTLIGYEAGYTIDSSMGRGEKNVFVGAQAGYGATSGTDNTGENNTGIGYRALYYLTSGYENTAVGFEASHRNTSGNYNTAIGRQALWTNMTGHYNVAIGYNCMDNHSPSGVVAIGYDALGKATGVDSSVVIGYRAVYTNSASGDNQTIVGYEAGNKLTSGANNTYYGWRAGYNNMTGSGNVCLGYLAGYSETGSNKLYIDNSSTSTPLIYGDFSTDELTINGLLRVTNILELSGLTSDPSSPADGSVWHRSDLNEIRVRLGGTTYKLTMSPA